MAKTSKIVRNEQRKEMVAKYAAKRAEYKEIIRNPKSSYEEVEEAKVKLQSLPKNSCPTRVRNRCELSGRCRGYYRKFGLSRLWLREKAQAGELPGVTKASW